MFLWFYPSLEMNLSLAESSQQHERLVLIIQKLLWKKKKIQNQIRNQHSHFSVCGHRPCWWTTNSLTSCSCWRLQLGASFINLLQAASHTEVVVYKNKADRKMCTPVSKLTRVKMLNWNQVVKMKCERHYSTHNNAAHIWFHTCSSGSFLRINIQVALCADGLCLNVGVERAGWGWSMCTHFKVNLDFLKETGLTQYFSNQIIYFF